MDVTYRVAWREGDTVLYLDSLDCKYAAKHGSLAWRINNPGLVKHHCRFAKKNGSIGAWEKFAIFSNPLQGHQALKEWLHSKTILKLDLYGIGKHYQSAAPEKFATDLAYSSRIAPKTKLKDLTKAGFESLITSIEKLCGFSRIGNEEFLLLPKIAAKIECSDKEDLYLIGTDLTLTKKETIDWISTHRLDGVIVCHPNGDIHLRSRPRYRMQTLKLTWEQHCERASEIGTLARIVGKQTKRQCIWGFINGIRNTREEAIDSSYLISSKAENEQVISLWNDRFLQGAKEIGVAILLKIGVDTPVIKNAVQFLRYLLSISASQGDSPVVIFAHSQGAAIAEHAIALLSNEERQKIRIFTFGGWSFIPPGMTHADSHNYASVGDLIPRVGSFNLQYIALRKYEGLQEGLNHEQIIRSLAFEDAIHDLACLDPQVIERYSQDRCKYYREGFEEISNVTIVESGSLWEHSFHNKSYQSIVLSKIDKYRKIQMKNQVVDDKELFIQPLFKG